MCGCSSKYKAVKKGRVAYDPKATMIPINDYLQWELVNESDNSVVSVDGHKILQPGDSFSLCNNTDAVWCGELIIDWGTIQTGINKLTLYYVIGIPND